MFGGESRHKCQCINVSPFLICQTNPIFNRNCTEFEDTSCPLILGLIWPYFSLCQPGCRQTRRLFSTRIFFWTVYNLQFMLDRIQNLTLEFQKRINFLMFFLTISRFSVHPHYIGLSNSWIIFCVFFHNWFSSGHFAWNLNTRKKLNLVFNFFSTRLDGSIIGMVIFLPQRTVGFAILALILMDAFLWLIKFLIWQ